jgi:hypothetical protein
VSALSIPIPVLPPTAPGIIRKLCEVQLVEMGKEQLPLYTEHLIHAGMYSRTVTMPPNARLIGALIKIPTMVIVVGCASVLVGAEKVEINGYAVLPASAGRKQVFESKGPVIITMIFPTQAKTVQDAEVEFTDEAELLLSRRQDLNKITITEEQA